MRSQKTKRVALLGVLFALALALSFLESTVTPLLGLPPGVKPGLSNIVVMYALLFLDWKSAASLAVLKSGFVLLVQGAMAGALSLSGGLCSVLVMALLGALPWKATLFILSVCGSMAHNFGQLLMVNLLLTRSVYTFYYAPVLLISGLCMGSLTALSLKAALPALGKINQKINDKNYQ